jgi:hypothetical protein
MCMVFPGSLRALLGLSGCFLLCNLLLFWSAFGIVVLLVPLESDVCVVCWRVLYVGYMFHLVLCLSSNFFCTLHYALITVHYPFVQCV